MGDLHRFLGATLNLSIVRDWTQDLHADRGSPSIGPVAFELPLIVFFEGIGSERKPVETASLNLARRCYLDHVPDQHLPAHSGLTHIRTRLANATLDSSRRTSPSSACCAQPGST